MTDNIVVSFIKSTPPITRILVALTVIVSSSAFVNLVSPQQLSYSRFCFDKLQFYRIFTTFFYHGKSNFELLVNFIFLYRYSSMLEENYAKKSDYFFVLFLIFLLLFITSNLIYIPFLAAALSNTLTYIWSRKNPQGFVQIFSFISFNAFYLPFVFPVISFIFDGKISKDEIVGIIVGQVVYYFKDVYPRFGRNFLKTPCWCHRLFNERDACCNRDKPRNFQNRKTGNIRVSVVENVTLSNEKADDKFEETQNDDLKTNIAEKESADSDLIDDISEKDSEDIRLIEDPADNEPLFDGKMENEEIQKDEESFESSDLEMIDYDSLDEKKQEDSVEVKEKLEEYLNEETSGFESLEIDSSNENLDKSGEFCATKSHNELSNTKNDADNSLTFDNKDETCFSEEASDAKEFGFSDDSDSFKSQEIADEVNTDQKNSKQKEPREDVDDDSWNSE